ncbi:hypothetical protein D7X74_07710 [Corallococcus sp. CA047B]|uniref:hypothetical protein n=1 Tax=Corallococcus sp. CA047B TaxID=2316729 RepID=UPI000EA0774B|nr:hypothetical protein [Corallococcus sp. CA047B]RKH19167.1 hypothetical protein D7X74_07710 [Corallococcus sp. CA047B]
MAGCTRSPCPAFTEHPERSWVLCEREEGEGHEGKHRWRAFEWESTPEEEVLAEERELLRRAEQAAGEHYE